VARRGRNRNAAQTRPTSLRASPPNIPDPRGPYDHWRFTRQALEVLFCDEAGFVAQRRRYAFPAHIASDEISDSWMAEAWLSVLLVATKRGG
jgi:hypothetical protein